MMSLISKTKADWMKDGDWKSRYIKLYSAHRIPKCPEENAMRISFMNDTTMPLVSWSRRSSIQSETQSPDVSAILSHRSSIFFSNTSALDDNLGGHETMLLDMVRAQSKEFSESQDQPLDLPKEDESDRASFDACIHGLSMRYTERSVSRSRFSRISTRRDMDIPSILAFTSSAAPVHQLENPAFQKSSNSKQQDVPRWSIRRSVCPVCSQKWKDRSAISNVKYSGLKRSSSSDLPSVIAPARLRAAITMAYTPRPALAVVDENSAGYRAMRNTSATWQLTRARKFRAPKLRPPPPEATAPPSVAAPLTRKDLDIRVNKFLSDVKERRYKIPTK